MDKTYFIGTGTPDSDLFDLTLKIKTLGALHNQPVDSSCIEQLITESLELAARIEEFLLSETPA